MQINKSKFKENLINTVKESGLDYDKINVKFIINPIEENNVKYNSTDDYIRLGMLTEKNLIGRYFEIDEAVDFLAFPNNKFPIWIKVFFKEELDGYQIFELDTSMRYRPPSQLKNIESGHPPFIFEKR